MAVVLVNICNILMVSMTSCFKVIAHEGFSIIEFVFLRSIYGLFISSMLLLLYEGINPFKSFPYAHKMKLLARCIIGNLNFSLFTLAATFAPISLVIVCSCTAPFWISILANVVNGEPLIGLEIASMIVCFSAVIVITMNVGKEEGDSTIVVDTEDTYNRPQLGIAIALAGSVMQALTATLNRSLKGVRPNIIVFYQTLVGLILLGAYILIEAIVTGNCRLTEYSGNLLLRASGVTMLDLGALYSNTMAY